MCYIKTISIVRLLIHYTFCFRLGFRLWATTSMAIGGGLGTGSHHQYSDGQWLTHRISLPTAGMAMGGGWQ